MFDMLNAEADTEMNESEPDTTAEKRVFDRKNAEVKDGFYLCNTCNEPVCKATLKESRWLSQRFLTGSHKNCDIQPFLKPK